MSAADVTRTDSLEAVPEKLLRQRSGVSPVRLFKSRPEPLLAPELRWRTALVRRLMVGDLLVGLASSLTAALIRFPEGASTFYLLISLVFAPVWVLACAGTRSYEQRFLGTGSEEFRRLFDAGVRVLALTALVMFAFRLDLARLYVLIALPLATVGTLVLHYLSRQLLHRERSAGRSMHRVVLVGRERACAELVRQFRDHPWAGFEVIGLIVDRVPFGHQIDGVPVIGGSDEIAQALRDVNADTVAIAAWSDLSRADIKQLSWELEGSGVSLVVAPSVTDIAGPRIHIRPVAGLPLLHVEEPEFSGGRRLLKGAFDRVASATVLLLISPVLLAIALAVRLDSRGPVFFRQVRVGTDGRLFTMIKFRSMHRDAEARLGELVALNQHGDGVLFKMRNDPRITRVGKVLRNYSLDELPQLFNIVRGDMSVVGPRPPLPSEVSKYSPDAHRRLLVKPGLTGLWQVSGRSELSWDESVQLDLQYVENWTLAMDIMIVWKTLFAVLGRSGAY